MVALDRLMREVVESAGPSPGPDLETILTKGRARRRRAAIIQAGAVFLTVAAVAAWAAVGRGIVFDDHASSASPPAPTPSVNPVPGSIPPGAAPGDSWIPSYDIVREQHYDYSLGYMESAKIDFTFRLADLREGLAITMSKTTLFGTFLHCKLTINGRDLGRCSDIGTRSEALDRVDLLGPEDAFVMPYRQVVADLSHDEAVGWTEVGVAVGDRVDATFTVQYITPAPSYEPPHTSGNLTVGVYAPAGSR